MCENELYEEPILKYYSMPKRAQFFIEEDEIDKDKGMDLFIYQCSGCGLIQLDVEPVSYYKDVIRAAGISTEMKKYRLKYYNDFINKYNLKNKKVIEIGSGGGEFLDILNETGVQAYGLEHSRELVDKCLNKGLKVYNGFIDCKNYIIDNSPYEAFIIMSYLEHIPNPNEFLRGIYNNLNDGAVGLIEVPNVNMILDNLMFSEFISDHLMYFKTENLKLLLEKNGFEVIESKYVWYDYVISMIVRKKSRLNLETFNHQLIKISDDINSFIDSNILKGAKVAIWGAGHQALAIITMTNISHKIQFVIDSADFKQNKYTPASHLKVVSPQILKSEKIDAILVMAASYSDEVAEIIRENYPKISVAILRKNYLEIME